MSPKDRADLARFEEAVADFKRVFWAEVEWLLLPICRVVG